MRRRSTATTALAVAALLLAGCGTGDGTATQTPSAPSASTPAPSPTSPTTGATSSTEESTQVETTEPAPSATPGIEGFDFANATWRSRTDTVTLQDGSAETEGGISGGGSRFTLSPEAKIVFADVDGDGVQDALVPLLREEGNGYSDSLYVWLWDEAAGTARQVLPAVGVTARCGDAVDAVEVSGPGELTVQSRIRTSTSGPCAEEPTEKLTQTVRVQDGFAWQTAPSVSALWCVPQQGRGLEFPGNELEDAGILAYPDAAAPVIADADTVLWFDSDGSQDDLPEGWTRLLYITGEGDKGERPPCGFLPAG